ncbi:hypothetical protein C8F04DRAFT_137664 [Mycena alexandri]|uniref:F-box domain-containing protein n=1 Tax=Mycena alexandri TaxID=1745969 RepID=A0AAD6SE75_9AGAR|nr:hypothetical protein C8F04DRAFT_137664 [Mycena alexandri]
MTNLNLLSLFGLPTDILILVFEFLLLRDLSTLSRTSRFFHALVNEFGWAGYQRQNPRPSTSLAKSRMVWPPMARVKHDVLADQAWSRSEFIARPLSAPWPGKERPVLAINSSRLVVAAGTSIYSYTFGVSAGDDAPPVTLEGSCSLSTKPSRKNCITALTFIPDDGLDNTLCVGFQDGTLERIVLLGPSTHHVAVTLRVQRAAPQPVHPDHIESLSTSPGRNLLLSLSAGGRVALADTQKPSSISTIDLQTRSWVSHLCMESSSPYAAFGTSSSTPLAIYSIRNDHLARRPMAVLAQADPVTPSSAVYGICSGPPSSLWGASPEVVVSGWYNGTVSIHDLRSSSRSCSPENQTTDSPAPLRPEMTLVNSWSDEPIYSVSSGGGGGTHIAAGAARHSLVSIWDVRYPTGGFSVHAPLNDRSPVYSVILESSRLFGVTESRPFVFDFGPGITQSTYPDLGFSTRGFTRLDQEGIDGVGYYVTKYAHRRR